MARSSGIGGSNVTSRGEERLEHFARRRVRLRVPPSSNPLAHAELPTDCSKHFNLESLPAEFRGAVLPHLENLAWHVENTEAKDLGDAQSMREVGDALGILHVICSGKFSEETQRNFRTAAFDASVEHLADLVERPGNGLPSLRGLGLERRATRFAAKIAS